MVEQGRINPVTGVRANPSQAGSGICRSEAIGVSPRGGLDGRGRLECPSSASSSARRAVVSGFDSIGPIFEVRSSRTPPFVSTDPHTFLLRLTTRCHFSDSRCVDPSREPPPSSRRQEAFGIERHLLTPQVIHAPQRGRVGDRRIGPEGLIGIGVPLLRGPLVRSPWLPQFGRQLPTPGRQSHQSIGMCVSIDDSALSLPFPSPHRQPLAPPFLSQAVLVFVTPSCPGLALAAVTSCSLLSQAVFASTSPIHIR